MGLVRWSPAHVQPKLTSHLSVRFVPSRFLDCFLTASEGPLQGCPHYMRRGWMVSFEPNSVQAPLIPFVRILLHHVPEARGGQTSTAGFLASHRRRDRKRTTKLLGLSHDDAVICICLHERENKTKRAICLWVWAGYRWDRPMRDARES